ncbi:MAG: MFS transporter [Zetaproteobacteria bacterium CG12_big_fil_rev_8_21_14_0_65_54_13]|nr:MAG: MFS transporter [Zetaproteobacteria bacterium CG1_02_53_45]PIP02952.1 MAG: MFS transporter [Zetaproteobacteria bacterium CG23_combo_of_CG06-09_8_20_14_all_54_7]PIW47561.1 MAG: MFS transporter [Zetaproteobacteria bacterium CG12_big_fil_rev_8_21_14_0_65_54_13]PIX55200.1 MAG: MFS transporter [Zetaproteobacteria bacterium CG_4_10_14_3_um_filter_54_28]PJA28082.1 MAG: MFS transporter [Zetaproteobacteria bacterium CG_4_9_14_3_um_filter_54_145]
MNTLERKAVFPLAGIYGLRMLGLFLILPVFALYADGLEGVTPALMGLALGAYGFTMAMLQIPFGWLSDRIGRKPVIAAGLLIFFAGSIVAAMADSIWGVILGRAIQGAGAIAAAMMALLADLTREEVRSKAMAVVGMTIGLSFTVALIAGPLLDTWIGVQGIFWLTAVLALLSIVVLYVMVPNPGRIGMHRDVESRPGEFGRILSNPQLLRLDMGILILNAIMTSLFIALPFVLRDHLHIVANHHPWVYLPVLLVAMAVMIPLIIMAESKGKMKQVFLISISMIAIACALLGGLHDSLTSVIIGLFLFFVAYNVLEATLPSLISRMAPIDAKGTAMGVYSSSQFFGAFLGGAVGGWCYGHYDVQGVFFGAATLALLWLLVASGMRMPAMRSAIMRYVKSDADAAALEAELLQLAGIHEAKVVPEENTAFLRVDKKILDLAALDALLGSSAEETL